MKNSPKLRFPEFLKDGGWEENCILNIASMKARIGWQNLRQEEHLEQGDYYLVTGTDFSFNKVDWLNAKFVSYERYIQDKHIILKEGDILITKDGSIGKVAYVENIEDKNATLNNGIFRIRINDENSKFIFYTFLSSRFKTFLDRLSGGSSIVHLYQKDFEKYEIAYPSLKEQQKIADCLSSVDSLISAQSQKVELLKEHKKALMQQLFPQDGEEVPKLRFPEFVNDVEWERKHLQKITNFVNKKIALSRLNPKKYISTENILQDFAGLKETNTLPPAGSAAEFLVGDILVSNIRPYLKKICVAEFDGGASNDVLVIRATENINQKFLSFNLKNDAFIDFVMAGAKGVKMPRGDITLIKQYPVFVPQKPKEQQKIADFLSSIDEQIGSQTRKLQTLKEHKKALMQQLFPSAKQL